MTTHPNPDSYSQHSPHTLILTSCRRLACSIKPHHSLLMHSAHRTQNQRSQACAHIQAKSCILTRSASKQVPYVASRDVLPTIACWVVLDRERRRCRHCSKYNSNHEEEVAPRKYVLMHCTSCSRIMHKQRRTTWRAQAISCTTSATIRTVECCGCSAAGLLIDQQAISRAAN